MDIYVTSDPHFGHERIIELCRRPFASVGEMDEALIANWNQQVKKKDLVVCLGDFSFHPERYRSRLNGKIWLVLGNHDPVAKSREVFDEVFEVKMWKEHKMFLSHYPHRIWPSMHHGTRHLFGHVHGETKHSIKGSMDVGMDAHNYRLFNLEEVKQTLAIPTLTDLQDELAR